MQTSGRVKKSFAEAVYEEADRYFFNQQAGRFAKRDFYIKSIMFLLMYIASYISLVFFPHSFPEMLLLAFMLGLCHVFLPVNLSHDAIHNAISSKQWINRLGLYGLEITGGNAYMYSRKHLEAQYDKENGSKTKAIEHQALVLQRKTSYSKTNLPGIFYLFFAQYMIFLRDFVLYYQAKDTIPRVEVVKMFFWKIAYTIAFIILPFIFIQAPWWQIMLALMFMYLVVTASLVIILLMPTEKMESTRTDENENHNDRWIAEILEHNVDFSPRNKTLSMLTGAANLNVVHHLFPTVNHSHYYHLAIIIEQVAESYGLQYRKQLVMDVFGIHIKYLSNIHKGSH